MFGHSKENPENNACWSRNAKISNLFKYLNILKLSDTVTLENPYF